MPIKVYYFDFYARAEPTRMMLTKANVAFEDVKVSMEEFKELKQTGKLEYGQMPMVELEDGTRIVQQKGIEGYFAHKYGFNCTDPWEHYISEHVMTYFWDFYMKHFFTTWFASPEEKPAKMEILFGTELPALLNIVGKKLAPCKKFFVSDTVKHIDFVVGMWMINAVLNPNSPMKE